MTTGLLEKIACWKTAAENDGADPYFAEYKDYNLIASGEKSIVIGRKGSGKTAIARKLHQSIPSSSLLNFDSFRYRELFPFHENEFNENRNFVAIWKYIIYMTYLENATIVSPSRLKPYEGLFSDLFSNSFDTDIGSKIKRLLSFIDKIKISVPTPIGTLEKPSIIGSDSTQKLNVSISSVIRSLEPIVRQACSSPYYIIFDDLDVDLDNKNAEKDEYLKLMSGLIQACVETKRNLNLRPLIFLRHDIYIQLPGRSKDFDEKLTLIWDSARLIRLISGKIATTAGHKYNGDQEAWSSIFFSDKIKDIMDKTIKMSQLRPRDVIAYIKICADQCSRSNNLKITKDVIDKVAPILYSEFLLDEIKTELSTQYDDPEHAIRPLRGGKPIFWSEYYYNRIPFDQSQGSKAYAEKCLSDLYSFGVIGNRYNTKSMFIFENPSSQVDLDREIVVHGPLFKALQIV